MRLSLGAKQPYEAYYIQFDFTRYLGTATISTATVTATDTADDSDVTSTITTVGSQSISGGSVYVWVKAGTTGKTYQVTCKITASDGSKYELDALLPVVEE
jgi:hypothetical protein